MSTTTAVHPQGSGSNILPELLLRQMLIAGLTELSGDQARLDELFARHDDLYGGSQDLWEADQKAAFRQLIETRGGIGVGVGEPIAQARLPWISCILESGGESGEQVVGNILAVSQQQVGTPVADDPGASRVIEHKVIGTGMTSRVQIGVWALAPEESMLLFSAVREVAFRDQGSLMTAGVTEVSFTESGFSPDQRVYPLIGYIPVLSATLTWTFRSTRRTDQIKTRARVLPGRFGN